MRSLRLIFRCAPIFISHPAVYSSLRGLTRSGTAQRKMKGKTLRKQYRLSRYLSFLTQSRVEECHRRFRPRFGRVLVQRQRIEILSEPAYTCHRHIRRVSRVFVQVARKITNLEICPSAGMGLARREKFRSPSILCPVHTYTCVYARVYHERVLHDATFHLHRGYECPNKARVSSRGPTDLCKRPLLGRALLPPRRKYFPFSFLDARRLRITRMRNEARSGDGCWVLQTDIIF